LGKVNLVPAQGAQLRDAQGVAESQEQQRGIPVAMAPEAFGRFDQLRNLCRREILPAAALRIPGLAGRVWPAVAPTFPKTSVGPGELDRDNALALLL
jgi:hypothetical protein